MRDDKTLIVRAVWDDEADVWVATSEDVPGLATEAATLEELMKKLKVMIPELLDENGYDINGEIPFRLLSECSAIASSNIKSRHTANEVLKQAGLKKEF